MAPIRSRSFGHTLRRFVLLALGAAGFAHSSAPSMAEPPRTLYWEGEHLARIKNSPANVSSEVERALKGLTSQADLALQNGPYSVVDKKLVPPSGDKHDYMSYSRYWWPNPDTDDRLPYVRRDGHVNRKLLSQGDRNRIGSFYDDVEALSLAAYLIDAEKYAPHARLLVRTWFINPKTRMNPNLKYGQAVPGRAEGRGVGIIDTRHFIRVLDAVALLDALDQFSQDDQAALKRWFAEYLEWLVSADLAMDEKRAKNNHGSWYSAQVARIALFVGRDKLAREIIKDVRDNRISNGIQPNGSQPEELRRTRSLHYSLFNLEALSIVARMGEHVDMDVWGHEDSSGASLQRGFDFVMPYVTKPKEWTYPQMGEFRLSDSKRRTLYLASSRIGKPEYLAAATAAKPREEDRYLAPLLFRGHTMKTAALNSADKGAQLTITASGHIDPLELSIPTTTNWSVERVRQLVPEIRDGKVALAEASAHSLLNEAFRNNRGKDLSRRQGVDRPQVMVVRQGVLSIQQLVEQVDDVRYAENKNGIVTLRLPVLVQPGAALVVDGKQTQAVRLSTDRGAFVANAGELYCMDALVTSWSENQDAPTTFRDKNQFRPFVASYVRSKTYVAGGRFEHLGFAAPTAYGFSLSSHPERERGQPSDDWPTGAIVGAEFRGLYYGFYSYEARDVAIIRNRYRDSIVYGIDPHDRSTRLAIVGNSVSGTIQKHGIIGSRGVSSSVIADNVTHGNKRSGIMLDRQCTGNMITGNKVYKNGQGIAIYESPTNVIASNLIAFNEDSGLRVRNSTSIHARKNTLVGNKDFALEVYSKRLDDHADRARRGDHYHIGVEVVFQSNAAARNLGLAKANNLGVLHLSDVSRNVQLSEIAKQLGHSEPFSPENSVFKFSQELRTHSKKLRQLLADPSATVTIQGQATKSP